MDLFRDKRKGLVSLLPAVRNNTPVFLLALDGGGIRSLLSIYALKFVEEEIGMPISTIFDIISATSTSCMVATGLVVPTEDGPPMYSADDLLQVITSSMPEIFQTDLPVDPYVTRPRYDDQPLMDFLEVFYPGRFDSALTNLALTAFDRVTEDLYVFSTNSMKKGEELEFKDVLRATVASPNYFSAVDMNIDEEELRLVEGGLHAYNPTSVVLEEARKMYPFQPTVVLSLGSGTVEDIKPPFIPRTPVSPVWGSPFQDQKIRCQAELTNVFLRQNSYNYSRAQISLSRTENALLSDFHETTQFFPSTLAVLANVGERYVEENKKSLRKFCDYFRRRRKIINPLSERVGWDLPESSKQLLAGLHKLMPPLDYIEPDDEMGLAHAKADLLKALEQETSEEIRMKFRFFVFKGHPLYKSMKKWMKFFEENSKRVEKSKRKRPVYFGNLL